ncbi:von Willebrand factor [Colletotrichum higginsianum IMI 349063]|uniref:von Willebrand factor n=1 Tax=Colletotrichum higginsianum (strain IMI 349063) TaxID=759273 RepID=A0A1B7XQQ7_COLHI|nr:von Willebrand factor [Colletotrichum higginsianum IMI 349063]OBR02102.1 von Willebrand factor [Colletotrichum higginsianum IMI 349063]
MLRKWISSSLKSRNPQSNMTLSNKPFDDLSTKQTNHPTESPPAYTATAPLSPAPTTWRRRVTRPEAHHQPHPKPAPSVPPPAGMTVSTVEDPYAFLSSFDTIFVIDDSG